jgi:hypothetical protein
VIVAEQTFAQLRHMLGFGCPGENARRVPDAALADVRPGLLWECAQCPGHSRGNRTVDIPMSDETGELEDEGRVWRGE